MSTKQLLEQSRAALRADMAGVRAQIEVNLAEAKPIEAALDALTAERCRLDERIATLSEQLNAAREPQLFQLKQRLAELARTDIAVTAQIKALG